MKNEKKSRVKNVPHLFKFLCFSALFLFASIFSFNSFGQLSKDPNKFFGCTWYGSTAPLNFNKYFNQISPENAGKWGSVEGTRDAMNWNGLTPLYIHSNTYNMKFKQHCFVWGNQLPGWTSNLTTKEQWLGEIDEWYNAFKTEFPYPEFIDVVNEPVNTAMPALFKEALGGSGATGYDWIVMAHQKAKNRFPNAKLLINEYHILNGYSGEVKINNFIKIIKLLKSKGLIDGIGLQSHFLEKVSLQTVADNLDRVYYETGVPIYISELDLDFVEDQEQLNKYRDLFPILWGHPGVKGLTLWGYLQGHVWNAENPNAYLVRTDGSERPAMSWLRGYLGESSLVGKTIRLRRTESDNTYRYVTAYNTTDSRNPLNCTSLTSWLGTYEQFRVVDAGYGKIALQCVGNDRYVSDEMGIGGTNFMTCNRTYAGDWEVFSIISRPNGKIALQGHFGKFVSHENGTKSMTCNRGYVGYWEEFNYEIVGTSSKVKASLGQISTTNQEVKMSIYPNPVPNNVINIQMNGISANTSATISIVDLNGRSVFKQATQMSENTSVKTNLSRGMYFILVSLAEGTYKQKIMIE